jgi:hypothetical protein
MTLKETNNSYKILAGKHNEETTWKDLASVVNNFKICFRGTGLWVFWDVML